MCKFQLHTIVVNEQNLRQTLIKCTKWRLPAMFDFKLIAQLQMGPYMYAKFQLSTYSRFRDIESINSAGKKRITHRKWNFGKRQ